MDKNEHHTDSQLAVYCHPAFCFVLAQLHGRYLVSPEDALICRLGEQWVKHNVVQCTGAHLSIIDFPVFHQAGGAKIIQGGYFQPLNDFRNHAAQLKEGEELLVSGIVAMVAAARSFVLNGQLMNIALYEGYAPIESGR